MTEHKKRLDALRCRLENDNLDGFIIPRADAYGSKYPADHDERLKFISSFSGSAGNIVILKNKAIVMTDGRYAITIKEEVDAALFETDSTSTITVTSWLSKNAAKTSKIGFDPMLHTAYEIKQLEKELNEKNIELVPVATNPVDAIWGNQPAKPCEPAFIHDEKYAGRSSAEKREEIATQLKEKDCDHYLITATDAICWMLNIRGRDTEHSPTVQCSAIFNTANGSVDLFINKDKLTDDVIKHLGTDITLHDESTLEQHLRYLHKRSKSISYDPQKTPFKLAEILNTATTLDNPITLLKAKKNEIEQKGLREAHHRDSIAWIKFLHWIDTNLPKPNTTEMDASDMLDSFRKESNMFDQHGYGPIAGWAKNGANIHYHSTDRGDLITTNNLLLIDSGAQSVDGQTDITRAILVGQANADIIKHYTLVLKGHIALAKAVFPKGTNGAQLDTLARKALWEHGLNYPHGTGHGIGFYLDVHEGPANISPRSTVALEEGMLLSNEPGYYKEGDYGIRLENEVLVQPFKRDGFEHDMLHFETISFVPFDRRLIDASLFEKDELAWLNNYHAEIYKRFENELDKNQRNWLKQATATLEFNSKPKKLKL